MKNIILTDDEAIISVVIWTLDSPNTGTARNDEGSVVAIFIDAEVSEAVGVWSHELADETSAFWGDSSRISDHD